MATRRDIIALGTTAAFLFLAKAYEAFGAQTTVEVVAMTHYPVQNALKPVRDFLTKLGGQVKVTELDSESPAGEKRIKAAGEKGHVPILLLVNGSDKFKRADGTAVVFKDFPAGAGNPLGLNGSWSIADFEAAVKAAVGQ